MRWAAVAATPMAAAATLLETQVTSPLGRVKADLDRLLNGFLLTHVKDTWPKVHTVVERAPIGTQSHGVNTPGDQLRRTILAEL